MGNSIKKHLSPKSIPPPATKVTKLTNSFLTSSATPAAPTKSNILLVCDDEFMKKDAMDLISSMTLNKEIDGHSITSYDLMNDIYMFYGGRGGYRPLRRTVGGKLSALIVCIDNTLKTRIPNLDTVRTALNYMNDGETIPLLIIGMSPNEASKAAKLKEHLAKANKKNQSVMKSIKNKLNKTKNDNASTIIEETPMDSNEIESLLNESLGLQSNALFSSFHIISLITNKDNTNKDNNNQLMAEGIEWLKKTLKGKSGDQPSSNTNDPPAVVKEDAAKTMPFMVAPRTDVNVTTESAHIAASA